MLKVMDAGYVYCFRVILKISQATGLRDPECGCSLSPFNFLKAGCSGNQGEFRKLNPRPVRRLDRNRGQHPASSEVNDDSARQD